MDSEMLAAFADLLDRRDKQLMDAMSERLINAMNERLMDAMSEMKTSIEIKLDALKSDLAKLEERQARFEGITNANFAA